jgi:hypothetical protein
MLKDAAKLMIIIANYAFKFSFTTWIPHLQGEKVFGLAKHNTNYFLEVNDESHRPNHINISCPHVVVGPNQPNTMDKMCHIHQLPFNSWTMYPIIFQGGIGVKEIICEDGMLKINCTSRNWPKCNHFICDYMQLLVICNYIWTFLQLFLVLVIFGTTLQLVCDYFDVHPSMWTTFNLVFIQ